jgi:RecA/RadA recombinase
MAREPKDLSKIFAASINMSRPKKSEAGTFAFTCGKTLQTDVKYVLTTGIEPYDEFVGGFPFSHISEVFGLENCGKTAMMIRSMCRFQAHHIYEVVSRNGFTPTLKRVDPAKVRLIKAYIDNEGSLENSFKLSIHDTVYNEKGEEVVETTSLDLEKLAVGLCDTIEQVFKAVDKFLKIIEEAEKEEAEMADDDDSYEPKTILGLFIVDTIASTSSKDEMERDWDERDFPRAAGKISEGFRRLCASIMRRNVALICTNQVRTQFNPSQGGGHKARFSTPQERDFSTFGGKALHFYGHHRVFMFQMPVKYTLVKGAKFPAGYMIGFRTVKNRIRKGGREGRMVLLFDEEIGGLNNTFSILETLIFLDAAEYHESGGISFKFKAFGIETTTFAEPSGRSKKPKDPEIEGRYEWLSFYRAHRADIQKLWQAAIEKANKTEGLYAFNEPEESNGEDADPEQEPTARRTSRRAAVARLEDPDEE